MYPALAVAEAYRAAVPGVEVLFFGTAEGPEARLLLAHGYRLLTVPAAPFFGVPALARLQTATALVSGTARARRALRAEHVELVLGLGSYATAGTMLGARTLGIPTVVHEANVAAGVTNRLLGHVVDGVLLGNAAARSDFTRQKTVVTGTPVLAGLRRLAAGRRPWAPKGRVPFACSSPAARKGRPSCPARAANRSSCAPQR